MKHPNLALVARAMGDRPGDTLRIANAWHCVEIERVAAGGPFRVEGREVRTLEDALLTAYRDLVEYTAGRTD